MYKWTPDFELTKPRPGAATKGGNSLGPKFGKYSSEIQYRGDGKQAVDPAPSQGFRKELPAPSKPDYATVDYEPSDATPTTQAEIYKTHR